ncbi:MAG: hypothetical protein HON94_00575 [Methylococcales bacterium]|jgi:hypothetical protein|nr:hypothetical protein [Methylococcales bacterium]MBT7411209.1 hypothetical protein [Methylococcales bacterium]
MKKYLLLLIPFFIFSPVVMGEFIELSPAFSSGLYKKASQVGEQQSGVYNKEFIVNSGNSGKVIFVIPPGVDRFYVSNMGVNSWNCFASFNCYYGHSLNNYSNSSSYNLKTSTGYTTTFIFNANDPSVLRKEPSAVEMSGYFLINNTSPSQWKLMSLSVTLRVSDLNAYNAWVDKINGNTPKPLPETPPKLIFPANDSIFPGSTKTLSLKWQASNVKNYSIRVEDMTGAVFNDARNNCAGDPHYICIDGFQKNEIDISVIAGHKYRWWVHADGVSSANLSTFSVEQEKVVNGCVSEQLTQHLNQSNEIQNNLRFFRDQTLQESEKGQHLIRLYYKHSAEMKSLVTKKWALKILGFRLLLRMNYAVLMDKKGIDVIPFNDGYSKIAHQFIDIAQRYGSDELNEDFEELHELIDVLHGLTAEEIKDELFVVELPTPTPTPSPSPSPMVPTVQLDYDDQKHAETVVRRMTNGDSYSVRFVTRNDVANGRVSLAEYAGEIPVRTVVISRTMGDLNIYNKDNLVSISIQNSLVFSIGVNQRGFRRLEPNTEYFINFVNRDLLKSPAVDNCFVGQQCGFHLVFGQQ